MGKGSHGVLKLGDARTIVRNPKDELKTGTYHAMLKQLALSEKVCSRSHHAAIRLSRHPCR